MGNGVLKQTKPLGLLAMLMLSFNILFNIPANVFSQEQVKSADEMRNDIQLAEQNIVNVLSRIRTIENQLAKGVSPKEAATLKNRRIQLVKRAEVLMAAFLKNLENYKATAKQTADNAFMQFLEEAAQRMVQRRNKNLAKLQAIAQEAQQAKLTTPEDKTTSPQDEALIRKKISQNRQQILTLITQIIKLEKTLPKTTTELARERLENQILQSTNRAEQLIASLAKEIAFHKANAEKAANQAFLQFLKTHSESLIEIRTQQIAKIRQRIEERKQQRPLSTQQLAERIQVQNEKLAEIVKQIILKKNALAVAVTEEAEEALQKEIDFLNNLFTKGQQELEKQLNLMSTAAKNTFQNIKNDFKVLIQTIKEIRAKKKAERQAKRAERKETRQEEKLRLEAQKAEQKRQEAIAFESNKTKVLTSINNLKPDIATLERNKKSYSRQQKNDVVKAIGDKINAIEKFARQTNVNKDRQVKDALSELNKLFRQAK